MVSLGSFGHFAITVLHTVFYICVFAFWKKDPAYRVFLNWIPVMVWMVCVLFGNLFCLSREGWLQLSPVSWEKADTGRHRSPCHETQQQQQQLQQQPPQQLSQRCGLFFAFPPPYEMNFKWLLWSHKVGSYRYQSLSQPFLFGPALWI